jgi:TATA-binding protein-associated factor Taf7
MYWIYGGISFFIMECDRFIKLVKSWYVQVQNEGLAPARMVSLMKQHIADCRICLTDPGVRQEVDKIIEIILPPAKVRLPTSKAEEETDIVEAEDLAIDEIEAEEGEVSEERDEEEEEVEEEEEDLDEEDF